MTESWWTLILETGAGDAPLAQRETLPELPDIVALLDEQEATSDVYRFVKGDTAKPERELRYAGVIALLEGE